jgi:hypothetical protein
MVGSETITDQAAEAKVLNVYTYTPNGGKKREVYNVSTK